MTDKKSAFSDSQQRSTGVEPGGSILGHIWASIGATIVLGAIVCIIYPLIVFGLGQLIFPVQANGSLIKKDGTMTSNDKDPDVVGSALIGQPFTQAKYFHPRPSAANNSAGSSYSATGGYDPTSSGGTNYGPLSDALINGARAMSATTQPTDKSVEQSTYDGIRLRAIHYALDNGITFNLYQERNDYKPDGTFDKAEKLGQVPLSKFQDAQGNLNDLALIDAFPHPSDVSGNAYPPDRVYVVADDFAQPIPGDAVTASGSGLDPHISPGNAQLQAPRVAKARNMSPDKVKALIAQYTDGPDLGILGDAGVNVLKLNLALDNQK